MCTSCSTHFGVLDAHYDLEFFVNFVCLLTLFVCLLNFVCLSCDIVLCSFCLCEKVEERQKAIHKRETSLRGPKPKSFHSEVLLLLLLFLKHFCQSCFNFLFFFNVYLDHWFVFSWFACCSPVTLPKFHGSNYLVGCQKFGSFKKASKRGFKKRLQKKTKTDKILASPYKPQ